MDFGEAILRQRVLLPVMQEVVLAALDHRELTEAEIRSMMDAEFDKIESQCWSAPEPCCE